MALDPSIILRAGQGVTPLLTPAEIQDQQMQREAGTYKLNALRQQADDDTAYRNVLRSGVSADELPNKLYSAGLGKQAQEAQKFQLEQQKAQREARKAKLETGLKHFEVVGQLMSGVKDQASLDLARQQASQIFGPDAAANIPQVYDPAQIEQRRVQAMTVKDQMEQQYKRLTLDETRRGHDLTRQTALETNANTVAASRANNAATIANSAQTAQMADARAREFNATKVEENKLKREAKQETLDMTKAGQVASFDTMLGTLDRLKKHPGLDRSVGKMSAFPTMPGSDSANFQAELETFQSQAFVPMVAQLKGMGALSDAEGRKLTAAVGALNKEMSPKAFRESVERIIGDMNAARARVVGPSKGGASGDFDAPAKPVQRKTVGGKTYENDGKGWYAVE